MVGKVAILLIVICTYYVWEYWPLYYVRYCYDIMYNDNIMPWTLVLTLSNKMDKFGKLYIKSKKYTQQTMCHTIHVTVFMLACSTFPEAVHEHHQHPSSQQATNSRKSRHSGVDISRSHGQNGTALSLKLRNLLSTNGQSRH